MTRVLPADVDVDQLVPAYQAGAPFPGLTGPSRAPCCDRPARDTLAHALARGVCQLHCPECDATWVQVRGLPWPGVARVETSEWVFVYAWWRDAWMVLA